MNRPIKFRAWDVENQTWTFVTLGDLVCGACLSSGDKPLSGGPQIWEQSTGLKDKNSKEIYEGDIVRIMGYGTYEVFWRSWDSSFSLKAIDTDIEEHKILMLCEDWEGDYTIIGNIHENPELLEVNNGQ